jgi:hypothetical protein
MPKDEWNIPKPVPEGFAKQTEREARHDAFVDAWVAEREKNLTKNPPKCIQCRKNRPPRGKSVCRPCLRKGRSA